MTTDREFWTAYLVTGQHLTPSGTIVDGDVPAVKAAFTGEAFDQSMGEGSVVFENEDYIVYLFTTFHGRPDESKKSKVDLGPTLLVIAKVVHPEVVLAEILKAGGALV